MADLDAHDVLGFDRSDALLRAYAAHGLRATRTDFPIRCDDQMVYWNLRLAGAGLGFAQVLLAARHPELELAEIGLALAPLPAWLVLHEEVRGNARIRRVADCLTDTLGALLRGG